MLKDQEVKDSMTNLSKCRSVWLKQSYKERRNWI